MPSAIYNLRQVAPTVYQMAKMDEDFNVAAVYNLIAKGPGFSCDCPANARTVKLKPCKHQRMMRVMMGAVNTNRFYDPESGRWSEPLASDPAVIDNREVEMTLEPVTGVAVEIESPKPTIQPPKSSAPVVTRRI